jgi:formylglycine-generating enzyme required for sulfatase activity/transposase-like protein
MTQSWSNKERSELIKRLTRGELTVSDAARRYEIPLDELQSWVDAYFSTGSLGEEHSERKILARLPDGDAILAIAPVAAALSQVSRDHHIIIRHFIPGRTINEVLALTKLERMKALEVIDDLCTRGGLKPTGGERPLAENGAPRRPGITLPASVEEPAARSRGQLILGLGLLAAVVAFVSAVLFDGEGDTEKDRRKSAPAVAEPDAQPEPEPEPEPEPCPTDMAYQAAATLELGSRDESPALATARPPFTATVSSFCIDRSEVTVAAYGECVAAGGCEEAHKDSSWPQGQTSKREWERAQEAYSELCNAGAADREGHPINCVTWYQAAHYCSWLGKRLPYEVEWELAARGPEGRPYPWGADRPGRYRLNACGDECRRWRTAHELAVDEVMYEADDEWPGTAPVGSFHAGQTPSEIQDLAGNVFEWTADGFYSYPEAAPADAPEAEADAAATEAGAEAAERPAPAPKVDPRGPTEADQRIIRGGAFNSTLPEHAHAALRYPQAADAHAHGIGFRCAKKPLFEPTPKDD